MDQAPYQWFNCRMFSITNLCKILTKKTKNTQSSLTEILYVLVLKLLSKSFHNKYMMNLSKSPHLTQTCPSYPNLLMMHSLTVVQCRQISLISTSTWGWARKPSKSSSDSWGLMWFRISSDCDLQDIHSENPIILIRKRFSHNYWFKSNEDGIWKKWRSPFFLKP